MTNTAAGSSSKESKTESILHSLSGIWTSEILTDESLLFITEQLTALPQASHASPFPLPERDEAIRMNAICGLPQSSAFAWYDPDTSCWRMFQVSLLTNMCDEFTATWPKAGIVLNGVAYLRQKWEQTIREIGGGLWLTTPNAQESTSGRSPRFRGKNKLPTPTEFAKRLWPTPRQRMMGAAIPERTNDKFNNLESVIARQMFPTPKAQNANSPGLHGQGGMDLQTMVTMYPTPQSRDWKGKSQRANFQDDNRDCLPNVVGGQLNPMWVDWLMGFPIGYSGLEPLEMHKFQQWLQQFGDY